MGQKRDLLSASDIAPGELENLLELTGQLKGRRTESILSGKTLGLLFFDRSLRTRVSFEVAMVQLGGTCINITADKEMYDLEPEEQVVMDGSAEEHVKDAARTLSRYVDALGVRHSRPTGPWDHDRQDLLVHSYAEHASVPVINCESVMEHPCQGIADMFTMRERMRDLKGRKLTIAWCNHPEPKPMGPSHSLLTLAASAGMDVTVACPLGFELDAGVMETARGRAADTGGSIEVNNDLRDGVRDADVVYARSWGSTRYWQDTERDAMVKRSLQAWRVDDSLMEATDNAFLMHPLPVRRNVVATDAVLDGPRSVIYDQAENRLHVQKALLVQLLG